jgi:sigma-B regulation protein RsbU (phosphoserine phosphatase)
MERDPHGMAMGAMSGAKYRDARWHLDPGDMLFLYTDGVPEANNSEQELFGNDRMMAALEKSLKAADVDGQTGKTDLKSFLRSLRSQIDGFVGETPQFDDLTMMCVSYFGKDTNSGAEGTDA